MLSAKPWKADAIVRLVVSVFVCMIAGSLVTNLLHAGGKAGWKLGLLTAAAFLFLGATLYLLRRGWTLENLVRRGWTLDNLVLRSLLLLCCFYTGFVLSAVAQQLAGPLPKVVSPLQILIGLLSLQGAGLVLIFFFLGEHRLSWHEAFGFGHRWRYALLLGLMLACLYLPIAEGLQWAILALTQYLPWVSIKPEEQQAVQALRSTTVLGERIVFGVGTILLAPITEEILFRGILYPWGKQVGHPRLALWGTALLFASVHAQSLLAFGLVFIPGLALVWLYDVRKNSLALIAVLMVVVLAAVYGGFVIVLPLFVLALALTLLYEVTDNLLAPIAAHSLFNGLNFLKLYLAEGSSFLFLLIVLMMILFVTLLLAFSVRRDELNR